MTQYICPMHPEVIRDKPGICPECGMKLVPQKNKAKSDEKHEGHKIHDKHEGHSLKSFAKKFWVSLILTIPVVLYSELSERAFGFTPPIFPGSNYLPAILASVVFFYGGASFILGAVRELKAKLPGMMTLISLAITAAYIYSIFSILFLLGPTLFWELTTLITVMLAGHWMEMKAVQGTQSALTELSKLLPDTAEVVRGKKTEVVKIEELKVGDIVLVRPGGKIPADGQVLEGKSDVTESMVTGESKPVLKEKGSDVIAGTINGDGALKVKVTKIGEDTFLAGVMRLVEEAQSSKSRLQILSDRAAAYLTFIAITVGAVTFIVWLQVQADFAIAVERLVAVLVIACPHALGLAVPLVATISTTMAAKNGFLVRQRVALEVARKIDIVLFDKTGTLTKGEYGVEKIWKVKASSENEVLQKAASVDAASEHFISKAIVGQALKRNLKLLAVSDFKRIPGKGVRGKIEGRQISVGGRGFVEGKLQLPKTIQEEVKQENQKGKTIIYVFQSEKILGVIALTDLIREESQEAVKALKEMNIRTAMITGDSKAVAAWVAKDLGLTEYFAQVNPAQKAEKVKLLQEKGAKVAMVGDGINDAPALTQADLGVAIGAGTNVAIESAGIILVRNDPRDIVKIIKLSQATFSKMKQNLFWATGYNIVALPLAAGVLAFQGILLQPALSALFMSASTVIVAVNALMLKRADASINSASP